MTQNNKRFMKGPLMWNKPLFISVAIGVSASLFTAACKNDAEPWKNTIAASDTPPDFVKSQWEEIIANGQFALPTRDWEAIGLPPGLEEQVWDAWKAGAQAHWRNVSPGYTNVIYDAKIDDNVITLLLDGFGLVQSKDAGKSWKAISHHLTSPLSSGGYYSFDISPADPGVIAVAGPTIDRSLNGGRSWSPVVDQVLPPFKPTRVVQGKPCFSGAMAFGFVRFNSDGSRLFAAPGAFGHSFVQRGGREAEMASWLKRKLIYAGDAKVSSFKAIDLGDFAGIRFILPHFSNPDLVYASFSDGSIYVCRNARAETPVFTELVKPELLNGLQAICMDVSPEDPSSLLLTMSDMGDKPEYAKSKVVIAKVDDRLLSCRELKLIADGERPLSFASARWNPCNPSQIFIGTKWGPAFRVYNDVAENFSVRELPKDLLPSEHTTGYASPRTFLFDRKSDLSAVYSVTGAWASHDNLNSLEELIMTHDYSNRLYGNKGVGFAECGESICVRKANTYIATNDHGAWRSNGEDTTKWRKISDNPGIPKAGQWRLCFPMAVSEDERIVFLVSRMKDWESREHKLMRSLDKGETWQDVTPRLGVGNVVVDGIDRIVFDPSDAKTAWILSGERLFITSDGGERFSAVSIKSVMSCHQPWAYDPVHKTIYSGKGSKINKSLDKGFSWTELPAAFSGNIHGLGVLDNGDLAVSDDGRLMVIPYGKLDSGKIEQSMIRLTIGESSGAAACGQRTFKPLICRGNKILAFTNNGWNHSNAVRNLGPLLSLDGGKSFQWIVYDLSCCEPAYGLDMSDSKIIVGNRGIHELELDFIKNK